MGPWYSPYQNGPDPDLVEEFTRKIRRKRLVEALQRATEAMRQMSAALRVWVP